jgi:N-methylhydantoinase A/oxoprolinase/acetone carboxylase beta subunit
LNLFDSVLTGLEKVTDGVDPQKISRLVLSTTLTTNAIAQDKLAPVAMIISAGPGIDPELYRTNPHYFVVSGAIDHRGRETEPIDENEIKSIAGKLKKENIGLVGIVTKFSVRNPAHELAITEIIKEHADHVFLGHQISGRLNFPRRIATVYLNAAVYPIHKKFYASVTKSLETKGLDLPIRLLKADGGNMQFESSLDFPGQTILSGPAASVMGALAFASEEEDSLVMDIGGTTTDMALFVNRAPLLDPLGITLGAHKTLIRALDTHSIGLGGDSAVSLANGKIKIGPERLGPAMAYGGPVPTPTDAFLITADIKSGDRGNALKGMSQIADQLGLPVDQTAHEIFDLACRRLIEEARGMIRRVNSKPVYTVHELLEGYTVAPKNLLVLGGPAPQFADGIKEISDYRLQVVPRWRVANAIGAALARTTCEVSLYADTEQGILTAPNENFRQQIPNRFSRKDAVEVAFKLLKEKALSRGANPDFLEMELLESAEFNMVRGFHTAGKNIRVSAQVKPGLIHGYNRLLENLSSEK